MSVARRLGRNFALLILGRFAVLAVWLAMTPAILARLGAEKFGYWSLLLVIVGTIGTVDLGLGLATSRFVSEAASREDHGAVRSLVIRAAALQLLLALTVALAGFFAREPLLDLFHVPAAWRPEAHAALAWALFGFVAVVPFNVFGAALQGLQRMDLYAAGMVPGAIALYVAIGFALRSGEPLIGVVLAQVFQLVFSALLLGAGLGWILAGKSRQDPARPLARSPVSLVRLLRFGGWVQTNAALALANQHIDKILLGALVALPSVAAYELGMRVMGVAMLVPQLALAALLPVVVQREAAAHAETRLRTYRAALGPYLALVALITCALVGLAEPLLESWLSRVQPAELFALRGLALAGGVTTATGVASTMVRAAERPEIETRAALVTVSLHLALSWAGWAFWGFRGVVAGLIASSVLGALYFVIRVERWLELTGPLSETARALLAPTAASLLAGAVGSLIAAWARTGPPGRLRGLESLGWGAVALLATYGLAIALLAPAVWNRVRSLVTIR